MKLRIGFGYDVHPLKESSAFFLGGMKISHHKGSVGHSDADVLIHAICDALLGAANLHDIGFQFPDSSKEYKGIERQSAARNFHLTVASATARVCRLLRQRHKINTVYASGGVFMNDIFLCKFVEHRG